MRRFTLIVLINLSLLLPALAFSWGMKPQVPVLAKSASRVFMERCFRCHGANGQTLADGVFVNSRALLVKSKKLIPGDVNSAILKAVESGAMPPPQKPGDRLPAGELATLREWVAKGAPDWQEKDAAPVKRKLLVESDLVASITKDLESAPERDRRYLRYYSIAHLYNADIPEEELQGYRVGLSKLLNSLSWARKIHIPVAIDSTKVLLRIDLRDYDWSVEIWGSIVSYYPYGYKTAKSEAITRLSGAVTPYVRADWFVERASLPPLYHIILKLPDTIEGLENLLKVEVARRIDEEKQVTRAGLRKSGVSQNNRVVERHETDYGAYWKSYDFSASDGEQNIFINPLDLKPAGGEMIFNLPNGMQAYFIVGKGGKRLDAAPAEIVSDRNHPDEPIVRTGRSCMSCHYGGIKDAKDGIRAVVEKSQSTPYDRNKVLAIYRSQASVDSFIKEDSERFQEAVRLAGGLPAASPTVEPINALSRKFKGEVSLIQAAAEAGLSVSELQKRIGKSQRLQQLGYGQLLVEDGGMKRDAWESYFGDLVMEASLGQPLFSKGETAHAGAPQPAAPTPNAPKPFLVPVKRLRERRDGKTGLELVQIDGGAFNMGSNASEMEQPVRKVKVGGFWISKNVVTVGQYKKFCEATGRAMPGSPEYNGTRFNIGWAQLDHPMVNVSWDDAKAYCDWAGMSLPTEAEWEYAARGGFEGKEYPWGDTYNLANLRASKNGLGDSGGTVPTAIFPPNGFGLYDMAGNVWQWVSDSYANYNTNDADNPKGPANGIGHIIRGGGWLNFMNDRFRCSYRFYIGDSGGNPELGFRPILRLNQPNPAKEPSKVPTHTGKVGEIEGKTGLVFASIPAGAFWMGSEYGGGDEKPVRRVSVRGFHMSQSVVTVEQYRLFCDVTDREMPNAPSYNPGWTKKDHPIVNVSWNDAKAYCAWAGVDLPTEAEWEYAARGGLSRMKFPWGDEYDERKVRGSLDGTTAVGSLPPNGYGLYGMVGNVWQWCSDWHGAYNPNDTDNPKGAATGTARVLRGGAWDIGNTDYFRCAVRAMSEPAPAGGFHSFRVVFRASSQTTHSKEPPKPEVRGAVNPKDGAALASIPAGEFVMGEDDDTIRDYTLEGIHRNNPRHTVKLSGYYLYKNVVTVGQYEAYCKAEGKQMPSAPPFNAGWAKKSFPIVRVTWDEARAYAKWAGGDLPSEAQWERAARGTDGRKFPWGDTFDSGKLWCSKEKTGDAGGTAEVGRYGFSPSGCSDMAGNVWQWCLDWYDADYWKGRAVTGAADPVNLNFGLRKSRVLRGGSWYYFTDATFPCAGRMGYYPNNRSDDYGFRVALRALR